MRLDRKVEVKIKKSLSQKVYELVIDDILTGKISQDSVITERMLIEKFGTSKSPVRDSLIRLCNEDILVSIPRYGYKIKLVDKAYLEGIIEFRLNIEPIYLEKYFDRITASDILRIEKNMVAMDRNEFSTPSEYWNKTTTFHLDLAYSYRDKFYYDIISKVLNKQLLTFSKLYWNNWDYTIETKLTDNHHSILEAIKAKDKEKAILLMKKDIRSF